MSDLKDKEFPTLDTLAMACCISRQKGFTSVSKYIATDPTNGERWNNKEMLTYAMMPFLAKSDYLLHFKPTEEDVAQAEDIIKYYRRLMFGVIADNLTSYMQGIFNNTQQDTVKMNAFGFLASVPSTYEKEIQKKILQERIKSTKAEHIGALNQPIELDIVYIGTRFVEQVGCWSHDAITSTNHLVSFLSKEQLGKQGDSQKIKAKVKAHRENYHSKTPETQLNYVKVIDNEFVWQ
jgi:hypothetical protein